MRKLHTRRGGFTLIELMIVVAIIGILAAIAIPNFLKFQLRSKTGEAKTNLAAMRTAEEGYFAEYGVFVVAAAAQPAGFGASKTQWPSPAAGFDTVGWGPEGEVYFQYMMNATPPLDTSYTLEAIGDLDGGGLTSDFGYIHPDPAGAVASAPSITTCVVGGVFNAATGAQDLLDTVGQCEMLDGQEEF
jgi:type IV pilus assembly protein PilA